MPDLTNLAFRNYIVQPKCDDISQAKNFIKKATQQLAVFHTTLLHVTLATTSS